MSCPYCASTGSTESAKKTSLGYLIYWCGACRRTFNERTGTSFNHLTYPTDLVFLVVLWRLRYHLSLRNLAEMFLERGLTITHETIHEWERHFAPLLSERLRQKRRGKAGRSWHCDETYIKVQGR